MPTDQPPCSAAVLSIQSAVIVLAYFVNQRHLSNTAPGTSEQHDEPGLPTIQPATPNKGAPSQTSAPAHANVTASSGSSTTDSRSELTSHSSRDSLPAAQAGRGDTTPQRQTRNNRHNKPGKPSNRWSRGRASSDDTGSDRKPPESLPTRAALDETPSPQPTHRQRQPHLASRNPTVIQERLMATAFGSPSGDSRRGVASPRPKGRGTKIPFQRDIASLIRQCRS